MKKNIVVSAAGRGRQDIYWRKSKGQIQDKGGAKEHQNPVKIISYVMESE